MVRVRVRVVERCTMCHHTATMQPLGTHLGHLHAGQPGVYLHRLLVQYDSPSLHGVAGGEGRGEPHILPLACAPCVCPSRVRVCSSRVPLASAHRVCPSRVCPSRVCHICSSLVCVPVLPGAITRHAHVGGLCCLRRRQLQLLATRPLVQRVRHILRLCRFARAEMETRSRRLKAESGSQPCYVSCTHWLHMNRRPPPTLFVAQLHPPSQANRQPVHLIKARHG